MSLRKNQYKAINISKENNFQSGVHSHCTGSGKSWIALEIIIEYNKQYPGKNIIWLCEQKSILIEQFNRQTLAEKGYKDIFKKFLIINYTQDKPAKWYDNVNSASIWKKPILLIINRSFLVSKKKYENIKINFDLIIHDECHSITNNTTQQFYEFITTKNENISCIGFSATPELNINPYTKILSNYSIYDAFCDNVIVKPTIKWIKCDREITNIDYIHICKLEIEKLNYKKVIVWCGMIDLCKKLSLLWKSYFPDFLIAIDTSIEDDSMDFEKFNQQEKNAILFCACKHREGSDIKNLDGCIFLDKVENRNSKTFVQCIGRVLRKDKLNIKKYGLILDLNASSCLKICDRVNPYLESNDNFPWIYNYSYLNINNKNILLNSLELTDDENKSKYTLQQHTIKDITKRFIKKCPNDENYVLRLQDELEIISKKNLSSYLIRAIEILELTNYIPHVTRGSCGSSLVCYLLGISNVDPVKYNITFERFLNDYRDTLPDIDLDFPHYLRDEVFLKLELTWPNKVARISNHVHWHEKSALREALRKIGINTHIPKEEIYYFVQNLSKDKRDQIKEYQKKLENTFRYYSLHCGGIVFFNEGVPQDLVLKNDYKTISQIIYDKNDVSREKNFKIDILSSRGISQLLDICGRGIDFSDCEYDEKTYTLLQSGNNIGVTLAESPLMRKALLKIKPKNITDIAICLAIIRPAAKDARLGDNNIDFETKFIFDDDAINILSKYLNISNSLADKFRRCLSKDKWNSDTKKEYDSLVNKLNKKDREVLTTMLANLRKYSFCKSHSYSYAQLVYKLAYEKAHNPSKFWRATLKNSKSFYRKWVHLYEACLSGVNVMEFLKKKNKSIYAESRVDKFDGLTKIEQLQKFGYWDMTTKEFLPNCYFYEKEENVYYFGGIVASMRVLGHGKEKTIVVCLSPKPGFYIELIVKNTYHKSNHICIKGRAELLDKEMNLYRAKIAKFF